MSLGNGKRSERAQGGAPCPILPMNAARGVVFSSISFS